MDTSIETAAAVGREMPYSIYFVPKTDWKRCGMAKPNYAFAKRQRDLAKKQKKEEKKQRKAGTPDNQPPEVQPPPSTDDKPPT